MLWNFWIILYVLYLVLVFMGNCHVICTDINTSLIFLTSSTACLCCLCGDLSIFMAFFLVLSAYNPGDSRFVLSSTSENSAGYLLLYDKLNGLILCQYIVLLMNLIFGQGSVEMLISALQDISWAVWLRLKYQFPNGLHACLESWCWLSADI